MKLRIRALQIRVKAENGIFGCDLRFDNGLVLLRAENSKGKSTCLMSILYALGLEGMLGASHQVPLQPVLLTEITTDQGDQRVIESFVRVEAEGEKGVVTITRMVAGESNLQKLVSVVFGPDLTAPSSQYASEDFFIRLKGDSDSEHGFHTFLADFVGWTLPKLTRFDGTRGVLYLACLAPYFFVDQLSGWRDIKARMPTYLQIPEMARRSAEYLLSLDILRIALANIEIREREEMLKGQWHDLRQKFLSSLPRIGIVARGLPEAMPQSVGDYVFPALLISVETKWLNLEEYTKEVRRRADELAQQDVPTTSADSAGAVAELSKLEDQFATTMRRFEEAKVEGRLARDQLASVEKRLTTLREDYRQYDDDRRLRERGGELKIRSADDSCPTCGQHISGLLLPEGTPLRPMLLEENIAFLRDQITTFREMHADAVRTVTGKAKTVEAMSEELDQLSGRVRAQKELLRSQSSSPSVANIQERLALQTRLAQLDQATKAREELERLLQDFTKEFKEYIIAKKLAGEERLTDADRLTLGELETRFLAQLRLYEFESYRIERLSIDSYTYRPSNEGVDLGITSASDAVRVVWAYLLGILEVARVKGTNHPGLLIFDEPKQQMVKDVSFTALIRRAAESKAAGQQIIFGTSQRRAEIEQMLEGLEYTMIDLGNEKIIKRIPEASRPVTN